MRERTKLTIEDALFRLPENDALKVSVQTVVSLKRYDKKCVWEHTSWTPELSGGPAKDRPIFVGPVHRSWVGPGPTGRVGPDRSPRRKRSVPNNIAVVNSSILEVKNNSWTQTPRNLIYTVPWWVIIMRRQICQVRLRMVHCWASAELKIIRLLRSRSRGCSWDSQRFRKRRRT